MSASTGGTAAVHEYLEEPVTRGAACVVLSPHLDDAVLSCGALLSVLAPRCPVTVVTVFSAATPGPHTRAARSYLRQCGATDADALYAQRRAEDRAVLDGMGIAHRHLDVPDALFRRRNPATPLVRGLGVHLPELVHRYPTYRLDIARGRISRGDRGLAGELRARIGALVEALDAGLVLAPLGVGRHVDHLLTRMLAQGLGRPVVHYSDFPYDRTSSPDRDHLARYDLHPWRWHEGGAGKAALIRGYRTQVDALFPGGSIPTPPETYYLPRPVSPPHRPPRGRACPPSRSNR